MKKLVADGYIEYDPNFKNILNTFSFSRREREKKEFEKSSRDNKQLIIQVKL